MRPRFAESTVRTFSKMKMIDPSNDVRNIPSEYGDSVLVKKNKQLQAKLEDALDENEKRKAVGLEVCLGVAAQLPLVISRYQVATRYHKSDEIVLNHRQPKPTSF